MASSPYANDTDHAAAGKYEARQADWRNGPVVYQVLVDRFAPPADLASKQALYPPPKKLRNWTEQPTQGHYLESHKLWSQEIDFWGGDLASLRGKLDYIQSLGADVLYLNPTNWAYTNHKYDSLDYLQVSPEFGSRQDLQQLAAALQTQGMKLVLDGVFNHMGRNSPKFQSAATDPQSPYRDWFVFGDQYPGGARAWWQAENLPELNLENPAVQAHLWADQDSVVRSYLRDGVDGWRLDVAFDIGFAYLHQLTQAAHAEKPGSLVVGEIPNFPKEWYPSVDGVMHFGLRKLLLETANGQLPAAVSQRFMERLLLDADYEHTLKSWIYLDNHDTPRSATTIPNPNARRLAQVLQFTLPGSPNLYYGSELDMQGGNDPEMRGPMAWDRVAAQHPSLAWTRQLIALRKSARALRVGDYRRVEAQQLIAFERYTDRVQDTVVVLANPSFTSVQETVLVANSKLMEGTWLMDALDAPEGSEGLQSKGLQMSASLLTVQVPAHGVRVLRPDLSPRGGYTNYKRVQ
jgi:cyclomaltodextrinase / maltogenic alpha-amylase / neopullulanase